MDYNSANELFQGVAAMVGLGFESEDDEKLMKAAPLKIEGVKGIESFYKKTGVAELTLIVGDRFFLSLNGTNQKDLTQLEAVAEHMDLAKLAKL